MSQSWRSIPVWQWQKSWKRKYVTHILPFIQISCDILPLSRILGLRFHRSLKTTFFIFQFLWMWRCFQVKCKIHCNKGWLKFLKILKIFRHRFSFLWKFSEHQKTHFLTCIAIAVYTNDIFVQKNASTWGSILNLDCVPWNFSQMV